ncbi:right-handed parallel beta-helix repeat-containing protein [Cytophaga aurantiaca]|uniref:right-handed parallel beta-helix repeat-containing protein n=1 Tax=Cytophaga aurantiaca TaxID=29530 RepID=UPI0012F816C3|nr:right-handed parallel beta-helix repeat-containing protein [Cytophaga aurantiaca]
MRPFISTALLFFALIFSNALIARTYYVNANYTGTTENGLSWATPFKKLEPALAVAAASDEIWIAKGTYVAPSAGYYVNVGMNIYGGFAGNETSIYERDLVLNKTLVKSSVHGAIFFLKKNSSFKLDGLEMSDFGAGIYQQQDTITFTYNYVPTDFFKININNCKFYDGGLGIGGPYGSDILVQNTTFFNLNSPLVTVSNNGTSYSATDFQYATVKFDNVTAGQNSSVALSVTNTKLEVSNSSFNGYNSPLFVGDYYSTSIQSTVFTGCNCQIISGNLLDPNVVIDGCTFQDFMLNCGFINSGRVNLKMSNSSIKNVVTNNNFFTQDSIDFDNVELKNITLNTKFFSPQGNVRMNNCTIDGVTAASGTTQFLTAPLLLDVRNSTFKNNAMQLFEQNNNSAKCNFYNCVFDNNTGVLADASYYPDMMYLTGEDIRIENCQFTNNSYTNSLNNSTTSGLVTIKGSNNRLNLINTTFKNNKTVYISGAVLIYSSTLEAQITDCIFDGNTTSSIDMTAVGALYLSGISLNPIKFKNTNFINNYSNSIGAINSANNSLLFENCLFQKNKSTQATSSATYVGYQTNAGVITLMQHGGGSLIPSKVYFINCNFLENESTSGLAGIACQFYWGDLVIQQSVFKKNKSLAPIILSASANIKLENSLFDNNIVSGINQFGSIIYHRANTAVDCIFNVYNCTFVNNGSSGIYSVLSGVQANTINNSIFWNNGTNQTLRSIGPSPIIKNSNIQGGGYTGTNLYDVNPLFEDAAGGNYRLSCQSPLINKGNNAYASGFDLDGKVRIFADTVDIGAYEKQVDPAVVNMAIVPDFTIPATVCKDEVATTVNVTGNPANYIYRWNFGNGQTSTQVAPTFSYTQPGSYSIQLTASNMCGQSNSITKQITVRANNAPTISTASVVCPGDESVYTTNATCSSLVWTVTGGNITSGNNTTSIHVTWGNGASGNGKVELLATGCGTGACEIPVSIEIPITPVNFTLAGNTKVCQGSITHYGTVNKDKSPSTMYTWSVKNGNIYGTSTGYNLADIDVQWSTTALDGVVYLTTYNEFLKCGRQDSFIVALRPTFRISGSTEACGNGFNNYSVTPTINVLWNVAGTGNTINTAGTATWANTEGSYKITAVPQNLDNACNAIDTFIVHVTPLPVVTGITGEKELILNSVDTYTAQTDINQNNLNFFWSTPGGSVLSTYANTATIKRDNFLPDNISVFVKTKTGNCASAPVSLAVTQQFVYTISGPVNVCIGETGSYTVNTNPLSTSDTYTWKSTLSGTSFTGTTFDVAFTNPGTQQILLTVVSNGKTFNIIRNVNVNYTPSKISIEGPAVIDPAGLQTSTYTIKTPANAAYTYNVTGGVIQNKTGNVLTVKWSGTEPFEITATDYFGASACTGVPVKFVVTKARELDKLFAASKPACLNSSVVYTFTIDEHTKGLSWSLNGGGNIVQTNNNTITIEWTQTGSHTLTLNYDRFGAQVISLPIVVNALPQPQVSSGTICGTNGLTLSTTQNYSSYQWYLNDALTAFSTLANPSIIKEGMYIAQVTDNNGCVNSGSEYIKQIPLPKAGIFSYDKLAVCYDAASSANTNISLSTFEGQHYNYQWFVDNVAVPGNNTYTLPVAKPLNVQQVYSYKVKVTLETCEQTSEVAYVSVSPCNGGIATGCTEPSVSFVVNSLSACQPITFTNTSPSTDEFGWSFGDGTYSTKKTPDPKTYTDAGLFNVQLTRRCRGYGTIIEVPAAALFKLDEPGCKGQSLLFKDLSVNIPLRKIAEWKWNFGDGTEIITTSGARDQRHAFADTGKYTVKLTIKVPNAQGDLCDYSYSQVYHITAPPVADFLVLAPLCTGSIYTFIDKSVVTYGRGNNEWTFSNSQTSYRDTTLQQFIPGNQSAQLKVTDLFGCTNTKTTALTVTAPYQIGAITKTSADTLLCNGRKVTLTAPLSAVAYQWKKDGVDISGATAQTYDVTLAGNYSVTYAPAIGCTATTGIHRVNSYSVPNLVSGEKLNCVGSSITIKSNLSPSDYSYKWKHNTDSLPDNNADLVLYNITAAQAGNYFATVTQRATGCFATLPAYAITVNPNPAKPNIFADALNICYSGTTSIHTTTIKSGNTFSWYQNGIQLTSVDTVITTNPLPGDATIFVKVKSNATGCSTLSDNLIIRVAPAISIVLTGDTVVCQQVSAELRSALSTANFDFQWYKNGIAYGSNNSKLSFSSIQQADSGSYNVRVTSKGTTNQLGCTAVSNTKTIKVKATAPTPVITGAPEFCSGSSTTLTTNLASNFVWNTGATTPAITVSSGGSYFVTSTNPASGCTVKTTQLVTQNPLPDLNFIPSGEYARCGTNKIAFDGLNPYPTTKWFISGQLFSTNKIIYPIESGKYTVTVSTAKGCTTISDTMIINTQECACYVINTNDSGDGSLREAINCSNDKPGKDAIKFNIPGTGPFIIKPITALPVIKDSVFVDGFSQPGGGIYKIILDGSANTIAQALVLKDNLSNVKISGLTFIDFKTAIGLSAGTFNNTIEKNIFKNTDNTSANIVINDKANNNLVRNNQFDGGRSAIELTAKTNNNIVESNTIANTVNGVEFKGGTKNTVRLNTISGSTGNGILVQNAPGNTIISNTIGTSANNGIVLQLGSDSTTISSNYIGVDAAGVIQANQKSGVSVLTNVRNTIISSNTISGNALSGLLIKGQQATIKNNFIGINSSGTILPNKDYGIYAADSAMISGNTISNNKNYGVLVTKSATVVNNTIVNNTSGGIYAEELFNTISKNKITNSTTTVKAIDLHASTTTPGNANKQPAVFKSYRRSSSGGIIIRGTSVAGDTVEIFYNNNSPQQALFYVASTKTDAAGNWEIEIPQGAAFNPSDKNYYLNTATNSVKNTSELSTPFLTGCFTCVCEVLNTNDSGTGSLRAVIDEANAGGCMTINFKLTSPDTIQLATALNPITVPVTIVGPASSGPDPMIFIKGSNTFNGFVVNNEGAKIIDLGFTNFKQAVVLKGDYNVVRDVTIINSTRPLTITGNNSQVFSSAINTTWANDLSTFKADTLVYITGSGNQIGGTGVDNKITNGTTGVLVDAGTTNSILNNAIYNTTKAISLINNGNTNYDKPASLLGSISGSTATITGTAKPNDKIQIFSSTYIPEQATGFVVEVTADASGNWTATIPSANVDLTKNNYFVATSTSTTGNTSQLSPPIRVGNFVQVCYVTNTNDTGGGSLREAVNCANTAGLGTNGLPARIEFQLPSTPNVISLASGLAITNNYGVEVNARNIPVSVKTTNSTLNAFTWSTNNFKVKNLTFENFSNALYCTGLNAVIDSNNFVNNTNAIYVNAADSIMQQSITNNYFTGGTSSINSTRGSLIINKNTFGISKAGVAGPITGYGISATRAAAVVINNNTFANIKNATATSPVAANGYVISIEKAVSTISNNRITGNVSTALPAIRLYANKNSSVIANKITSAAEGILFDRCDSVIVSQNALAAISDRGLNIYKSNKVKLTQNTIVGLAAGETPIDLNLAAPANASNSSKAAPVILTSTYHDGKLFLIGQSEKFDEVEVFYSNNDKLDLVKYIEKSGADSTGTWIVSFPISAQGSDTLFFRAVATKTNNLSSEASVAFTPKLKICLVTTDADLGVGSLREAIDKANLNQCNLIQFAIPGTGVAEIETVSELPAITAPLLIIDGTSQNGYKTGSPTVDLINNIVVHGFNGQGGNQLDIYGMKITNFGIAINIVNSKIVNTSDNVIANATDTGINIKTSGFMYGNIENNTIASQSSFNTGINVDGTSKIEITKNRISDFRNTGISVQGNNQKLINNTLRASNNTTAIGISVTNSSSIYMEGDTIVQANVGFQINNGSANSVVSGVIGKTDSVSKARNYIVKDIGVSITASNNCFVTNNTINVSKNAVAVTNAKGYLINTNTIKKGETSVLLSNAPNGSVSNNTLDSALVGVQVDASHGVEIYNNVITRVINYAVVLNTGSDTCVLTGNLIGARYLGDPTYAQGTGVLVKSSNNYIGPDDELGLGNYIKQNKKGGVIVDGGTKNAIKYNFFYNNDVTKGRPTAYAIQLINGGNNTKTKPSITSHKWIGDTLHVYGTNNNTSGDSIHLYMGTGGYEETSQFLGRIDSKVAGNWHIIVDTAISNYIPARTTWYIVATATDANKNTSPLSDMYILGDCYITSLKDTTDNQYPLPNTMRMAMKCANGQANPVGIYFNVAQGGAKEVKLQMKMQDLNNAYGVNFSGKNIPDGVIAGMNAQKMTGTSWTIAATNAKSSITNFQIVNASNGLEVLSDSILVQKMRFDKIYGTGILVSNKKIVVDSCVFDSLRIGIFPASNALRSTFSGNTFNATNQGILAANVDSLIIRTSTFNNGVFIGIDINGSTHADISANRFNSNQSLAKSIVWNNSKGSIQGNTFTAHFTQNPVSVLNGSQINITNNTFRDSADVYLALSDVSYATVTNNTFTVATQNSIKTSNVTHTTIMNNTVTHARNDAFNLENSSTVFVSKNIVTNVSRRSAIDSALCINIHKGEGAPQSNYGKEEPKNLTYEVKNGPDRRKGIFVKGIAQAGDSIQLFFSDSISASMNKYVMSAFVPLDSNGRWAVKIPREFYYQDTVTWYHVIAVAIGADSNTSKTSSVLHIPPSPTKIYVLNEYNAGPNSLRQALLDVTYSDLYSKVIFSIKEPTPKPGPYNIRIDSLFDPVNSYMGFEMDGATQKVFAPFLGDQRIIVNGKLIQNNYGLDIIDSSKECLLKNIWMSNTKNGLRISNDKNTIEKIYFINTDTSGVAQLDTAFVIQSDENKIKNIGISDYKLGVLFQNQVGKNQFTESTIDSTVIGIAVKDSSYQNYVAKNTFTNTSQHAVLIDSAAADNKLEKNIFGKENKAVKGNAITIRNSSNQTVVANRISYFDESIVSPTGFSAIVIEGKSSNNFIYNNRIGLDSLGTTVHIANTRGITIQKTTVGQPSGNSIVGNEINGTKRAPIYISNSSQDLISENIIGGDSSRHIFGIDTTAIFVTNSINEQINDNTILGYSDYGIELLTASGIQMHRNVIYTKTNSNKAINIHADDNAIASNGAIATPTITSGILTDISTIKLTGTALPNAMVEIYQSVKDTLHAIDYVDKAFASTNGTGAWELNVPKTFFSYATQNTFTAQNHLNGNSSELGNTFTPDPVLCQLQNTPSIKIIEPLYTPCPGPEFNIEPTQLDSDLHFAWKAPSWVDSTRTRKISLADTTENLVLKVTDKFGCALVRTTDVIFKAEPMHPNFIISSNVYAGDTIVLVDVSLPVPTSYTWYSSAGVTVLHSKDTAARDLIGEDGNVYPKGVRYIQFVLPDSGIYSIRQTSIRDGCFVDQTKEIHAVEKNVNVNHPYFVAPVVESVYAYPNPAAINQDVFVHIQVNTKDEVSLTLVTVDGAEVATAKVSGKLVYDLKLLGNGSNQLFTNNLSAGEYVLKLVTPQNDNIVFKIIIGAVK